ncbi:MAG: hypothetical protein K2W88_07475 [Pararheinheimera sp.]|nr:hypothetical protein [Rheinheimera sp.]
MKKNQNNGNKIMHLSKSVASLLLVSLLYGCVLTGSESLDPEQTNSEELAAENDDSEEATEETQDTETDDQTADETADLGSPEANVEKSAELTKAENQVKELEQQLASLKVEWEQQKPALERLVNSEADLEFLVQSLADMSQLAEEPSRDQYLGSDELTPEKRQESLDALQSLVTTQEELNTLLVELSTVVSEVAANSQNMTNQNSVVQEAAGSEQTVDSLQATDSQSLADGQTSTDQQTVAQASDGPSAQNSVAPVIDVSTTQASQQMTNAPDTSMPAATNGQTASQQVTADCNCSSSEPASPVHSDPAKAKDPSWYASTTPYAEATPAGSNTQVSQLDNGAASGQPIPGLQMKTFKRRSLPSELAAAGAPIQQYALAPQFHMSRKSLSDYVSQLAFKLAGNQQLAGNRIGVASFVFFDEQLEQTSSVGNQLAEELSTVLPNYGARVIEYKLTREITVSPTGDLSLSRNTRKLRDSQGMDYVLTGTMVPTRRGLQINSRVVSTRDNVVIASATTLIPAMVLQQL